MSCSKKNKKGVLELLSEGGTIIGDGSYVRTLEKRGYVVAGHWTPEACIENPEAVLQLHREFIRSGSDVVQAFTFYADDRAETYTGFRATDINSAAIGLAKKAAMEDGEDKIVAAGISQIPLFRAEGSGKAQVQKAFRKQAKTLVEAELDLILCEFFDHCEEIEWAIEVCKEEIGDKKIPLAASMRLLPTGDPDGVRPGECAVRMAKAGADIVGINCVDPDLSLESLELMKRGLDESGLSDRVHLMCQPYGFYTPDVFEVGGEVTRLPENPLAMEPRLITRWEAQEFAREAYEIGVRYIGGCCGFEAYHVRALSEELVSERGGKLGEASLKSSPWGEALSMSVMPKMRARAGKGYWSKIVPSTGRPFSASMANK